MVLYHGTGEHRIASHARLVGSGACMPKQQLPGSLRALSDASCSSPISRAATLNSDTAMWRARAEQEDAVLQIGLYHHIPSPGSCLALVASGLRSVHLVGDSRMRGLAVSLVEALDRSALPRGGFDNIGGPSGACTNHSYRYTHEAECAQTLPVIARNVCNGTLSISYKACWRVQQGCLDRIHHGLPSRPDLLILSIGLHDLINPLSSPALLEARLQVALRQRSCAEASVILTTAALCPPQGKRTAKFPSWRDVNRRIAAWNVVEARLAGRRHWGVLAAHALLRGCCSWSHDTVHYYSEQWPAAAADALLGAADARQRPPPVHWLRALSAISAGNKSTRHEPAQLVSEGPHTADAFAHLLARRQARVTSVWFGGSVTAEGIVVDAVHRRLQARLGPSTQLVTHNLGVPAAGPRYTSFCLDGLFERRGLRLGDIDAFFLEWAENDFEDPAISMESLLARLIGLPQRPAVLVYVHCGPRSWSGNCTRPGQRRHPEIARRFGALAVTNFGLHQRARMQLRTAQKVTDFRDDVHPARAGRAGEEIALAIDQSIVASLRLTAAAMSRDDAPAAAAPKASSRSCWTALGAAGERNLVPQGRPDPGWSFVSNRRETYPSGKNGWESRAPGQCISFALGASCVGQLAVFYLGSPRLANGLGRATLRLLPHARCGDQALQGLTPTSIDAFRPGDPATTMAGPALIGVPHECWGPTLEVCTRAGSTNSTSPRRNHSTFQVIAIGCETRK